MKIIFLESKKWEILEQNGLRRKEVEAIVKKASKKAVKLLPGLSPFLNLIVYPTKSEWVIPETGTAGTTYSEEYVEVAFDSELLLGLEKMMDEIEKIVLHELTHASSYYCSGEAYTVEPLRALKEEGLASTFEKKNGKSEPDWANYGGEEVMLRWYKEIKNLPTDSRNEDYLFDHPDGRKWIIYKTGVWAIKKMLDSDWRFEDLLAMKCEQLIQEFDELLSKENAKIPFSKPRLNQK